MHFCIAPEGAIHFCIAPLSKLQHCIISLVPKECHFSMAGSPATLTKIKLSSYDILRNLPSAYPPSKNVSVFAKKYSLDVPKYLAF